ncbi:MFS transporter [Streptomyces sp. NPDC028635]|uniref:MFS transporter n=1 Tax=Streptomyces sp. NPDC028635 TaxID=3154800 RepID=UPI00341097C8
MIAPLSYRFRALRTRNFRLFAAGQIVSVAGTWMMVVAQDWLVLGLTDDSAVALGTVTALQFTPMLFTLYGGRLADSRDKRTLLTVANLVSAALALLLSLMVFADAVALWHIHLFALALGLVNAVEVPARLAFISELVAPSVVPNASAMSAAYFNVARVLGPALAGLLLTAFGTGWVMLVNAVSYLATVAGLRLMRPAELLRAPRAARRARVVDGLRYTLGRPDLAVPMALVAVIGLAGLNFQLTLPLLAKTVFHTGASSFGLLTTVFAAGSLLGAFAAGGRSGRPSARLVTGAAIGFGLLEAAVGWAPTAAATVALLFLTGFATIYFAQAANHRVQLGSDPGYRGRVLALYTLVMQGSTPLGALCVGWLSEHWGARVGFVVGGVVSLAAGLVALAVDREVRHPAGRAPEHTPTRENARP